jgi:class 3 adenylate cyclase/tetratricopeptide (TPR) repeat protein
VSIIDHEDRVTPPQSVIVGRAGHRSGLPRSIELVDTVLLAALLSRTSGGRAFMKCFRCQHENSAKANFCAECAAPLAWICSNCGALLSATAKFCSECAHPTTARSGQAQFASPESYIPKHLADKILTSKAVLEGERKHVTVLFADLRASMELLADRDPEEVRQVLDPVLKLMIEAVHHYEGTVNQVMGDGVMALFGAPLAHEDHALRACYAALRMQEHVQRHSDEIKHAHGIPIRIRIGLNSGEVVVRSIGNDLHMDYTAVGQTTHLAARMEQMAEAGSILATANTLGLVKGYVEATSLGRLPVRGLQGAVDVYAIAGAGAARWPMEAATARGLTGFVGREDELAHLGSAMQWAAGGRGQVAGVVGEPGVGKSRLFHEFTRVEQMPGWRILKTGAVSYGKAMVYRPVIDLLRAYFEVRDLGNQQEVREKIAGKVLMLDQELASMLPALLSLLDVPAEDPQWQSLDPRQRRQQTMDAIRALLLRESRIQPLCVVFEDLHWIDSETQAFLDSLIQSLPVARILLLVNYRPEYRHEWGSKSYYTQLRVHPLPPRNAEDFLRLLLGDDGQLLPLKQLLIEHTRGNPFFLEESVRMKVEDGVLVGDRGDYRLAKPLQTFRVPATVETVLAARIDRLAPEDKRLLQAASVIGENVPVRLLEAVVEMPEYELRDGLARLRAAEFLYDISLPAETHYVFKHGLTRRVAYNSLLRERQRTLHARIVEAIERLYPERLGEHVEQLAHHAHNGELWDRAARYLQQAATKAFARSANREAVVWFDQALTTIQRLPESRELREQAIDLRFELRNALQPLGELGPVLARLREAEALATALGDQRRLGRVAAYLTDYFRLTGDHDRAIEWGRRALDVAGELGDFGVQVVANTWLGQVYFGKGDYQRAAPLFRHNVQSLLGELTSQRFGMPQPPAIHSRTCLAWCLSELGQFTEGVAVGEEAIAIAGTTDHPLSRAVAYAGLGWVCLRRGLADRAIAALEQSLEAVRAGNSPLWFPRVASALGYAYALAGRLTDALTLTEAAVSQGAVMNLMGGHSLLLAYLGEAQLLAGRTEDARQSAEQALALAREHKERGYEGWALRLLAEIALRSDPPDAVRAIEYGRSALPVAEALGMRPLVAHCHLTLARSLARAADPDAERRHLAAASELLGEMDMQAWLGQARAELDRLAG